ncbi:MAG TPA: class I SAM-dependent methyltransferase [Actinomycetota bacterium]|nr:class I SAM-dependent methyltransferase [Actinomycetota bacterium]
MSELRDAIRDWWDADAHHYDGSADHGLSDPVQAAAWNATLRALLPPAPAHVLDVGAGTGAMSLLAADLGHHVTALDLSAEMLAGARRKAEERGLELTFLVGAAEEPPAGPFDAVIERHVAWTLPDPAGAFAAWRNVAPGGRLVLFEGSWPGEGLSVAVNDAVARVLERAWGIAPHHHDDYPPEVLERLPLAGASSPRPFLEAVTAAGWGAPRLHRLADVEWAVERAARWPLGRLRRRTRYAIVADDRRDSQTSVR